MSSNSIGPNYATPANVPDSISKSLASTGASVPSGTSPFGQLSAMLGAASQEKTVTQPDGSSVTSIAGANGGRDVVSETSASGFTLTQAGYVSPALSQEFFGSLFQAFQSDQSSGSAGGAAGSSGQSSFENSVNNVIQKLGAGGATDPTLSNLQTAFDNLMQGSGITSTDSSGTTTAVTGPAALQAFLTAALPDIISGKLGASAMYVDTSA